MPLQCADAEFGHRLTHGSGNLLRRRRGGTSVLPDDGGVNLVAFLAILVITRAGDRHQGVGELQQRHRGGQGGGGAVLHRLAPWFTFCIIRRT